ncbi:MAG: S24/S26 family peptidase [Parasporobacterium sp.]|nr:S24/S26 family peptidase [Parasporobacterium sp.]
MKKHTISVEEWHELVNNGAEIPVTFYLQGNSMAPLLRIRRDLVTVVPLRRELIPGDIVLFWDMTRGEKRYVVHRFRCFRGDKVITIGDNCYNNDAPLPREQVLGLVSYAERMKKHREGDLPAGSGKRIELDNAKSRRYGLIWMKLLPVRRAAQGPYRFARRVGSKVKRTLRKGC